MSWLSASLIQLSLSLQLLPSLFMSVKKIRTPHSYKPVSDVSHSLSQLSFILKQKHCFQCLISLMFILSVSGSQTAAALPTQPAFSPGLFQGVPTLQGRGQGVHAGPFSPYLSLFSLISLLFPFSLKNMACSILWLLGTLFAFLLPPYFLTVAGSWRHAFGWQWRGVAFQRHLLTCSFASQPGVAAWLSSFPLYSPGAGIFSLSIC